MFYPSESFCELLKFGKQWLKLDVIPRQREKDGISNSFTLVWTWKLSLLVSFFPHLLLLPPLVFTWISLSSPPLDSTSSQHVSPHLRSSTLPLLAFTLIFSLPLSCSLCLSIYFTQSYLSLTLSALPPALLSFIFHSWVHSPPNLRPHLLSHPIDGWCGDASRASIRGAGGSLWRAISKPIPLIAITVCSYMTLQLSPVEREKESGLKVMLCQAVLCSHCRTEGKTFCCCCYQIDQLENVLVWSLAMLAPGFHTGTTEADWKSTRWCRSGGAVDCRKHIASVQRCFVLLSKWAPSRPQGSFTLKHKCRFMVIN